MHCNVPSEAAAISTSNEAKDINFEYSGTGLDKISFKFIRESHFSDLFSSKLARICGQLCDQVGLQMFDSPIKHFIKYFQAYCIVFLMHC